MQRRDLLLAFGGVSAMPLSSGRSLAEPFFRRAPRPGGEMALWRGEKPSSRVRSLVQLLGQSVSPHRGPEFF